MISVSQTGIEKISVALAKSWASFKSISKTSSNPFFKSKYADLSEILSGVRDTLAEHEISVVQSARLNIAGDTKIMIISTMLLHSSGQFITTECHLPIGKLDPQGAGSTFTYGRRYGLQAALCLTAEDDDGEAAQGRPRTTTIKQLTK